MAEALKKGLFITFEGTEGSGKSTQTRLLASFLRRNGYKVLHIWDPGSTPLGRQIRNILLKSSKQISARAETMLYMAARAQLVEEKILPALKKKMVVICDRFTDATSAYQGYGLGVDIKMIGRLNRFVTMAIRPDITFFLDADIKKGLRRSRNVKGFSDRIESRDYNFHRKVRDGYRMLAKRHRRRFKKILAEKNGKDKTQQIIRKIISDAVKRY